MTTLLVTAVGEDRPGITAALTGALADGGFDLTDIEQVVTQNHLTLCMVVRKTSDEFENSLTARLAPVADSFGLEMHYMPLAHEARKGETTQYAVTALAENIDARAIQKIANVLSAYNANIDSITRLSESRLSSLEIHVSVRKGADAAELRRAIIRETAELGIDIAVQREKLTRRSKRLVMMDMDSTLIQIEMIDELARMAGVFEEVQAVTHRAMEGELNFEESLKQRVGLLKGLSFAKVSALSDNLPITAGARELLTVLKALGYKTGVISGGFTVAANALKKQLGLDYAYANKLEVIDGLLTGRVLEPILGAQRKADLLDTVAQGEGILLEQTIAIGDGANDLPMLERAGLGIAFHAKPKVRAAADTTISAGGLDRILYLLGLRERDITELLRA